ncbi:MAG: cobalt-precorrin-6A reductase [Microcystaceae cyanobacterium]
MFSHKKIWLIGGTTESVILARAIALQNLPYIITVTTPEAINLYRDIKNINIQVGQLDQTAIAYFLNKQNIQAIVDASHPFATVISENVIKLAQELNIPYLRFERNSLQHLNSLSVLKKSVFNLPNFETLLTGNYLTNQRVLLTVGAKNLPLFKSWQSKATLFARILPRLNSLQIALDAGFTPERIMALRPPYSKELEIALWQQWQISLVVSKASGEMGGENLKQQVSEALNIPLIIIERPSVNYPQQTQNLEDVIKFCQDN